MAIFHRTLNRHHENKAIIHNLKNPKAVAITVVQRFGGVLMRLIGDATGHGVPAALVTASANCCTQLLLHNRPEVLEAPGLIFKMMNRMIYNLGGKILMTFFVGITDQENQTLSCSNAFHNSPWGTGLDIDSLLNTELF